MLDNKYITISTDSMQENLPFLEETTKRNEALQNRYRQVRGS